MEVFRKCDEYGRLMALGPRAVPFFVEEIASMEKNLNGAARDDARRTVPVFPLREAVERIVRKEFKEGEEVVAWWQSRGDVPARFRQASTQWQRLKEDGRMQLEVAETVFDDRSKTLQVRRTRTERGKAYFAIRELGIDALPLIVETLKAGDHELLPIFAELGGNRYPADRAGTLAEQARTALKWWEEPRGMRPASCTRPAAQGAKALSAGRDGARGDPLECGD
jgi:hypothetical protein